MYVYNLIEFNAIKNIIINKNYLFAVRWALIAFERWLSASIKAIQREQRSVSTSFPISPSKSFINSVTKLNKIKYQLIYQFMK